MLLTTSIILDVDTGMDDALALRLAVLDPDLELVAATTVALVAMNPAPVERPAPVGMLVERVFVHTVVPASL